MTWIHLIALTIICITLLIHSEIINKSRECDCEDEDEVKGDTCDCIAYLDSSGVARCQGKIIGLGKPVLPEYKNPPPPPPPPPPPRIIKEGGKVKPPPKFPESKKG